MRQRSCAWALLLAAATSGAAAGAVKECTPCCPPQRMDEPMTISDKGIMGPSSGAPCHVRIFEKSGLHRALAGRWLYFVGDSSTRGLFLALYYELLGAKKVLQNAKLTGRVGVTTEDAMLRTKALFNFGDAASRAECKETLTGLGRGSKWTLEECDDFGDPCNDQKVLLEKGEAQDGAAAPGSLGFGVDDSVTVNDQLPPALSFLKGVKAEVAALDAAKGTARLAFSNYYKRDTGEVFAASKGSRPDPQEMQRDGYQREFSLPVSAVTRDLKSEALHRCRKSRGATHSVSSLHLGFVDAGFCDGELVFTKVSPHDYNEGHMSAPLGAQVFPDRARRFAERMRRSSESCVRVTFRMLPQIVVLVNELDAIAAGAAPGSTELAAASAGPDTARFKPAANFPAALAPEGVRGGGGELDYGDMYHYFRGPSGDSPDAVYLEAGAWDRAMGCLLRRDFVRYMQRAVSRLAEAAPGAAFVLGTLPTGSAYPADPTGEMARLVAAEKNPMLKLKVVLCLKFTPGPVPLDLRPEDVARSVLLNLHVSEGDVADRRAEKRAAALPAFLRHARHLAANRSASDVWVLDRNATLLALPQAIRLLDSPKATVEFRRLHPAMVHNVWDVQVEVKGGGGSRAPTPLFARQPLLAHTAGNHLPC